MRKRRNTVAPSWDPSQLPNVWAWYRSDQGITLTAGTVLQWADILGSGRDLAQGSDPSKPTFTAGGLNGHATIDFDGVDDFLLSPLAALPQPATVFTILKQTTWTSNDTIYDGLVPNSLRLFQFSATPNLATYSGNFGPQSTQLAVNTFALTTVIFDAASSVLQVNNQAEVPGDTGNTAAGGFTLGCFASGAGTWSDISVAEIVIMTAAADSTQRQQMRDYVAARYAITM